MNTEELFVNIDDLPDALSSEEFIILLKKMQTGNQEARDKIVEHNIKLVIYLVNHDFNLSWPDKKELVAIGSLGLLKAVDTYDLSKNRTFATYASKCIKNEILMFLRKDKKYLNNNSLDDTFLDNGDGEKTKIIDFIRDATNIDENYINNETIEFIRNLIYNLPDKDKKIIMLHFGFYNDKIYTQKEIAKLLNITQSYVSRIITKNILYLAYQLEYNGFIDGVPKRLRKKVR